MNFELKDKICLVTASSKGLGRAVAEALASEGAKVVISGRDEAALKAATIEMKAAGGIACDLTKAAEIHALKEKFASRFGQPSILVVNMPGPPKGVFETLTWSDWQKGFESIYAPAIELIQWALPEMKAKGFGRIVLITSLSAKEPIAKLTISSSLRAGLGNLVKGLSKEVAPFNITVNAVLPGWTLTPGVEKLNVADSMAPNLPQKRLLRPREIGDVACFLCSAQASGITGQSILVDGASTTAF